MSRDAGAFVGREAELASLEGALDDALAGRGRLVLIAGEPGIGKSRLTDEFAVRAGGRGVRVVWGHCWEAGGAPPFWPWVECLRAYAEGAGPEVLREDLGPRGAEVAQIVPDLRRVLPELPESAAGDDEAARFRLFDATTAFLRSAAARAPLALILEDLHAADEPSLLLLRFGARALPRTRLMIVGTYRDTELSRDHPLTPALADLARQPSTVRLPLRGLTQDDVETFIAGVAGRPSPPELVTAVSRETEGNPLFVGELVRLLAGEGRLDRPTNPDSWGRFIPQGIREVIDRRFERLSDACVRVLERASVVGREFSIEVARRLDGITRGQLLDALDEAARARVVTETPAGPGWARFSHQLVRDALYDRLPPGQRAQLHRQVAEALLEIHGEDSRPVLAELAHHFFRAAPGGDASTAVRYCAMAGDGAAALLAYEEAARLYGMALQALDLTPDPGDATRCDLLIRLGEAQVRSGDAATARSTFLRAAEAAERRSMPEQLARAALGYGGRFVWARAAGDPQLVTLLERALAVVGRQHPYLRARLLARLAGALRDEFDPRRREELSAEAVRIARQVGDPPTLAYVLDGRWAAIWGPDTTEARLTLADELVRVAEAAGDRERTFQAHHYRLVCFLELGDLQAARRQLETKARIVTDLRQPAQRWYLVTTRALFAAFEGRFEEAERLSEEAVAIGERAYSAWDARFNHMVRRFVIQRDRGGLAELESAIRDSIPAYEMSYRFVSALLGLLLAEGGRASEARGLLRSLVHDGKVWLPRDNEWLFGMSLLADLTSILGERQPAALLYEELLPFAGRNVLAPIEAMVGSIDRSLALLAASQGLWMEAERHFVEAVERNRRWGAAPATARALLDHGRMLRSLDEPAARRRAVERLTEGLQLARRIGATALATALEAEFSALGEAPPGPERLTRAFMFTDIVASTALLEAIGDEAWDELRTWHDRVLRDLFAAHRGEEIEHPGDGFFVAFPGAGPALACAVAIQRALADHRRTHGFSPRLRIGIHAGEATRSGSDYVGKAVHIAARVGALAEAGEILVSTSVVADGGWETDGPRRVALKGIAEPVEIASLRWRG